MAQPNLPTQEQTDEAHVWMDIVKKATNVDLEIRHARGDRITANTGRPFVAIQDGGILCWVDEFPLSIKQRVKANKTITSFKADCAKLAAAGI